MLQRLIATVLAVLGLAAIALGIASATAWRADDTITASARTADGTTLVTTAPGVLELGDPPVTVRATAQDGTPVVVAMGRETDVAGWIGADPHTVVTGLSDWHTLATDVPTGSPAGSATPTTAPTASPVPTPEPDAAATPAAPPADAAATPAPAAEPVAGDDTAVAAPAVPDPAGSDLWVDEATGDGAAELVWTPRDGRWSVLAAATGDDPGPLTLQLSWPQTVTTPWLVPGVVGGAVLVLLAGLLALRARRSARRHARRDPEVTGPARTATASGATAMPAGTARPRDDSSTAPDPGATDTTEAPDGKDVR